METSRRRAFLASAIGAILALASTSATLAHQPQDANLPGAPCISQYEYGGDASCKAHWENSKMTYRWGG